MSTAVRLDATLAAPASSLMLVSALAGQRVMAESAAGLRPRPEYLLLRDPYGVEVFDWSRLAGHAHRRTPWHSLRHVAAPGWQRLRQAGVIFSDGEHLGIPVSLAKRMLAIETPHVMLGHHLTSRAKRTLLGRAAIRRGIDYVAVHSQSQAEGAIALGLPRDHVDVIPYGVDTAFWSPGVVPPEPLILSPGREQRDHQTLAQACTGLPHRVLLTGASAHSPRARGQRPQQWPANVDRRAVSYLELRRLYAAAALVVIPLLPVDFPAGVTTLLEAMAMGKAIIVSSTGGLADYVRNAETALAVPPGDSAALRDAIEWLLANPDQRQALGRRARRAAISEYGLELYAARLYGLLRRAGGHRG